MSKAPPGEAIALWLLLQPSVLSGKTLTEEWRSMRARVAMEYIRDRFKDNWRAVLSSVSALDDPTVYEIAEAIDVNKRGYC